MVEMHFSTWHERNTGSFLLSVEPSIHPFPCSMSCTTREELTDLSTPVMGAVPILRSDTTARSARYREEGGSCFHLCVCLLFMIITACINTAVHYDYVIDRARAEVI